jgi:uncharacterized protein YggE
MHTLQRVLKIGVLLSLLLAGIVSADTSDVNVIDVSGTGRIKVAADQAEISLAVITKGADIGAIQTENAEKMTRIISALKLDTGLSDKEISTSYYSVSEEWNPSEALKAEAGQGVQIYRISNTISIITSKVDSTGTIIDVAIANGANSVDSLQFSLTEPTNRKYREQALQMAVEKATADATVITKALGKRVGSPSYVQVGNSQVTPFRESRAYNTMVAMESEMAYGAAATPIQAGEVIVSASVAITYTMV